jgi:outer membrane protein assembly factor BamD
MEMGRYYVNHGNFAGAVTRFRVVVTRFSSSPAADEALFHLVDLLLKLDDRDGARTAAAVLNRKFPNSRWRVNALYILKTAGLEPAEDQQSWISQAFH